MNWNWKLFAETFVLVFLAELGDKTQLATMTMAASGKSRVLVFLGAAGALVTTSAMAVLLGEGVARVVPQLWINRLAGMAFVALGALLLLERR